MFADEGGKEAAMRCDCAHDSRQAVVSRLLLICATCLALSAEAANGSRETACLNGLWDFKPVYSAEDGMREYAEWIERNWEGRGRR